MFTSKALNKKVSSLAEIVIIVLLLAILMMSFIHYFFKQEERIEDVAFNRLVQSFSSKVRVIHAQWFMDKQPTMIKLKLVNKIQLVSVNNNGWVDSVAEELVCAKIWDIVITEPMMLLNTPISAIEVKNNTMKLGRICRFALPSGEYFQYNSENGKVSQRTTHT